MSQIWMGLYKKMSDLENLLNDPRYRVRNWKPVCHIDGTIYYCVEYLSAAAEDDA